MISLTPRLTRDGISVRIVTGFMLLFITIFFLLPALAGAQVGPVCTYYHSRPTFLYFDDDRHISGTIDWYTESSCTTVGGQWDVPADGWVLVTAATEEAAIAACKAALGGSNEVINQFDIYPSPFVTFSQQVFQCHNTPDPPKRSQRQSSNWPPPPPPPPPDPRPTGVILNEDTDLQLSAFNGLGSGIEFQRLDAGGIGIQSLLDLGCLDAVDVWSNIGDGYEVCFPQSGHIVFLDAAGMPRMPELGEPYTRDGYTCVSYARAGTVVLLSRLE